MSVRVLLEWNSINVTDPLGVGHNSVENPEVRAEMRMYIFRVVSQEQDGFWVGDSAP